MKYKIIKLIAKGSQGKVYLAKDEDKNLVIVKKIQKLSFKSTYTIKEYIILLLLQRKGNHKNICEVLNFSEENTYCVIILKYVDGVDMFNWKISNDKKILLNIVYELADGIKYMHDKNIYHRDIKSSNIIITQDNYPVIIDFGISCTKKVHSSIKNGKLALRKNSMKCIGTLGYMAPELFDPENHISNINLKAADIYSLGVVFFYLFNKKTLPLCVRTGKNMKEVYYSLLEPHKKSSSNIDEMDKLIDSMVSISYRKRPKIKKVLKIIENIRDKINEN